MFTKRFFFILILILTLGKLIALQPSPAAAQSEATPNAPIIVEAGWELVQTVVIDTPQGAHYNPQDQLVYVGRRITGSSGGVYRLNADGSTTQVAVGDRPAAVVIDGDDGDIFFSEDYGGNIYRHGFADAIPSRSTWVSGMHSGDDDPIGMAIAPNNYTGPVLLPGQMLVVDRGNDGTDEIWRWSPDTAEGEVQLYTDANGSGTLVDVLDVTISSNAIYLVDTKAGSNGVIYQLLDAGMGEAVTLQQVTTLTPLSEPAGIAAAPNGDLLVAETSADKIVRVNPTTGTVTDLITGFTGLPWVAIDLSADGQVLVVTDQTAELVYIFHALSVTNDYLVNNTGDQSDANLGDNFCDSDLGTAGEQCSLRAAIEQANSQTGADTILFSLPVTGSLTIQPTSPLPTITEQLIIDGTSQAGAVCPVPTVELNGSFAGAGANGLSLTASNNSISGLIINGFTGHGIAIPFGSYNNLVSCNYIGTDRTGTLELGNSGYGVYIDGSQGNFIGGASSGEGNLISGNGSGGVYIASNFAPGNVVQGNKIGVDATGLSALGNSGHGVWVLAGAENLIGGTTPEARNVIAGNVGDGIRISQTYSTANLVWGNYIGVNGVGNAPIPNQGQGIEIVNAPQNSIGGSTPGAGNLISGNLASGVILTGTISTDNVLQGNFIGTDSSGTLAIGNGEYGLEMVDASFNTVGGTGSGAGNLISGNGDSGILLQRVGNTVIEGNKIGTDGSGTVAVGNAGNGVELVDANLNTIGGTESSAGNLISGNNNDGILLLQSDNTVIAGNLIGTDGTGASSLGNFIGVWMFDSSNTMVGGTDPNAGNLISGNREAGVYMAGNGATNNTIQNNKIGTDLSGSVAVPNGPTGYAVAGIRIFAQNSVVTNNLISGNRGCGLELGLGGQAQIMGNFIGTDVAGIASIGNSRGVCIYNTSNNLVGGTTPEARNLISGNVGDGISLYYVNSHDNLIYGNTIGTDLTGTTVLGNGGEGVELFDAPNNWVGGTGAGMGNLISGNNGSGILITGGSAANNTVQANFIGTNISGTLTLGNESYGVYVLNAPDNLIGGTEANAGNLISGNEWGGISLYTSAEMGEASVGQTSNTVVQGNTIGTDLTGEIGLGNGDSTGVWVTADNNLIGGTEPNAGNLVSGNSAYGMGILGNNNQVYGNFVGTNRAGTTAIGNSSTGITITGSNNLVGGTTPQHRNLISGNPLGIYLYNSGNGTANLIQGNFIGTDLTGELAIPNTLTGIKIDSVNGNTIGGSAPGAGNLISGNDGIGLWLYIASNHTIQGNTIGQTFSHTSNLPNAESGILLTVGANNLIGGTGAGEGNLIAGNSQNGITIVASLPYVAHQNSISGNAIYNNGWLGIDLGGDGVTVNDAGDADDGGNALQNYPILTKATVNSDGLTTIEGALLTNQSVTYTLHFYANSSCETFGYGEGETYLGSAQVTTNNSGQAGIWLQLPVTTLAGQFITATATDPLLNTSEFSNCTPVLTNLLINPSFESGTGVGWTEYPAGIIGTGWAHTGSYSAGQCGVNSCTETVKQLVTIPTNGSLSYWWYMASQDSTTTPYDYLLVQLYDTNGQLITNLRVLGNTVTRNQWRRDTLSLAAFAGQTVWLRFTTVTNGTLPTIFYIDDVSVH